MTSDVIRRLYMSYNPLFHNCLHGHNFAKSEPMNGLEHLPTDSSTPLTSRSNPPEVGSLFKRTGASCVLCPTESILPDKDQLAPPSRSGDFPPKSENLTEKAKQPKSKKAWRKTGKKDRQKTED